MTGIPRLDKPADCPWLMAHPLHFDIFRLPAGLSQKVLLRELGGHKLSFFFFFGLFGISWAAPAAYGGSQAGGLIGAVAASHSHSHMGSKPSLRPTPQLTAIPDP